MKNNFLSKVKYLFLPLVIILFFVSCSSNSSQDITQKVETITIVDSIGTKEIPKNPKRIVDLSGNSDILYILGFSVVGTANSDAYDYTKFPSYLADILEGAEILGYSMQDTVDIEKILNLDPDLIVISKVQEKAYDQLKDIAPTLLIELEQLDWKEDLKKFGQIFSREDMANSWLSVYEANAEAEGYKIRNDFGEEKTYLPLLASGGQLYIFSAAGIGDILKNDMDLSLPQNLPEQTNISLPVVSYEGLAELNSDYIILVGTDVDTESLKANPIYQNLDAVKNGNVLELPSSPYFNMVYSCIGKNLFVNELYSLLGNLRV